jgi:hypothetical protein
LYPLGFLAGNDPEAIVLISYSHAAPEGGRGANTHAADWSRIELIVLLHDQSAAAAAWAALSQPPNFGGRRRDLPKPLFVEGI